MTLEEMISQMRESLTVTTAMTLRHETRLKEHQQWLEDNEMAYAKHRITMIEIGVITKRTDQRLDALGERVDRIGETVERIGEKLEAMGDKLAGLIDALRKGNNGHQ